MKQFLSVEQFADKYELNLQDVLDLVASGNLESILDPRGVLLVEDDLPQPEDLEEEELDAE